MSAKIAIAIAIGLSAFALPGLSLAQAVDMDFSSPRSFRIEGFGQLGFGSEFSAQANDETGGTSDLDLIGSFGGGVQLLLNETFSIGGRLKLSFSELETDGTDGVNISTVDVMFVPRGRWPLNGDKAVLYASLPIGFSIVSTEVVRDESEVEPGLTFAALLGFQYLFSDALGFFGEFGHQWHYYRLDRDPFENVDVRIDRFFPHGGRLLRALMITSSKSIIVSLLVVGGIASSTTALVRAQIPPPPAAQAERAPLVVARPRPAADPDAPGRFRLDAYGRFGIISEGFFEGDAGGPDVDTGPVPGFGVGGEFVIFPYLSLGARLQVGYFDIAEDGLRTRRGDLIADELTAIDINVVPKGRFPLLESKAAVYAALPIGFSSMQERAEGSRDAEFALNLSLLAGFEYFFSSLIGGFFEVGYQLHSYSLLRDSVATDTQVQIGTFTTQLGAKFAF